MGFSSGKQLRDLVRVYQDLERTIRTLRKASEVSPVHSLKQIHVGKLLEQLMQSKRRIRRKLNNRLLLERQQLKKRLRSIGENLRQLHH